MFNISRIPQLGCDVLTTKPPPADHDARKILVMLHDWFYAVEVFDKDMRMLEPAEIERRLLSVVADADHRLAQGEVATAVSVLTTDDRDRWAEVGRQLLLRLSGELTSFSEPPPSPRTTAEPSRDRFKALYDFQGRTNSELSMKVGEKSHGGLSTSDPGTA